MSREPAMVVGTITAFVAALIALLVAFGASVTEGQEAAILGMTAVLAPIIAAIITRGAVYAPDTVSRLMSGEEEYGDR